MFNAVDLATIAEQLDAEERRAMAESGEDTDDYQRFLEVLKLVVCISISQKHYVKIALFLHFSNHLETWTTVDIFQFK